MTIANLNNYRTNRRTPNPVKKLVNEPVVQSEARGFALYVGVDEAQAVEAGVSLTELVKALRATLNELEPPGLATICFEMLGLVLPLK